MRSLNTNLKSEFQNSKWRIQYGGWIFKKLLPLSLSLISCLSPLTGKVYTLANATRLVPIRSQSWNALEFEWRVVPPNPEFNKHIPVCANARVSLTVGRLLLVMLPAAASISRLCLSFSLVSCLILPYSPLPPLRLLSPFRKHNTPCSGISVKRRTNAFSK